MNPNDLPAQWRSEAEHAQRLAWLIASPEQAAEVNPADIPDLLGALETVRARLWTRLNTPALPETQGKGSDASDRLLDAKEAAERLGVKPKWMYSHADTLPFTLRIGERTVRFSEKGLQRWMEKKRASR